MTSVGAALLVACILGWLIRRRAVAAAIVFAVGWIPVGDLAIFFHLRGVLGEMSIPTLVLLVGPLLGRDPFLDAASRRALLGAGFATGIVFYPFAMGVSPVDPYAWGHGLVLPALLLPFTVLLWLRGRRPAAYVMLAAVAAFHARVLTSDNLWDYVLDPVLLFWGLGWAVSAWRNRRPA